MKTSLLVCALAAAALSLGACSKEVKTESKPTPTKTSTPAKANMGIMNSKCPMSGESVDKDDPTADYKGGKVAFCCKNCMAKFNNLSDADKAAKLAASK